jgi:multidrug efflux pump subunit AcrB
MQIIIASLKNPYLVATIVFALLILGSVALVSIPIDILPVLRVNAARVQAYNQGMTAEMVEKTMTVTMGRFQSSSLAAERVTTRSVNGVAQITTYFQDGSDQGTNIAQASAQGSSSLAKLPPNTLQPNVIPFNPTATQPLIIVGVTSKSLPEARLKDLTVTNIRSQIGGVRGAQALGTFGGKDRAVMLFVDPRRLEARGMAQSDVVNAVSGGNLLLGTGVAKFQNYEFQLDTNALVDPVNDLNDLPLKFDNGSTVFLRDVGRAEDSFQIQTSMVRIGGQRTVYTPVYSQVGASSVAVVSGVRELLPNLEKRTLSDTGNDVELHPVMDQTFYVWTSIEGLAHEAIVGAGLVSLMILLFLGNWRMTMIACLSIPLAALGAISGLWLTGNTLNMMTLAGLALAVGPLVDDAVVELENNHRHYEMGKSRIRAAIDGAREVMIPVMVATATTILVLSPIALMPGINGQLFRPLALAVTFAMLSSFMLSRTFVPMLCAHFLPDAHREGSPPPSHEKPGVFTRFHHRFEGFLERLTKGYTDLLEVAMRYRVLTLLLAFGLFVASLLQIPLIGQEFFPATDAGQIVIYARCPSGTNIEATERRVAEFEDFLKAKIKPEDLQLVISEIGVDSDLSAAYTANAATWDSTIRIQLTDVRSKTSQDYAAEMRKALAADPKFADMRFTFNTGGMIQSTLNFGAQTPIDVRVLGGTDDDAYGVAMNLRERIKRIPGTADVAILQRRDAPKKLIVVDRTKAAGVGLTETDVVDQVVAAMNSSQFMKRIVWIERKSGQQYWVAVQYPQNLDMRLEDVLNIVATGPNAKEPVKLSSLVTIVDGSTAVEINRDQFSRLYNVQVNVENRDIGSVVRDVQAEVAALEATKLPPGIRIQITGEYTNMVASFKSIGLGLGLAVLFVYALLVGLFRSFRGPFILMLTVPLGLIGVLTTLHLTQTTLNVQSGMGVIFLVGIAVSNGVLLIDYANHRRRQGHSVRESIEIAAATRFRPILMTFLATFLDLIPIAIGSSLADSTVPLARAVVGGMVTSTALTLFVVPCLYTLLISDAPVEDLDKLVDDEMARPEPGHAG